MITVKETCEYDNKMHKKKISPKGLAGQIPVPEFPQQQLVWHHRAQYQRFESRTQEFVLEQQACNRTLVEHHYDHCRFVFWVALSAE